MEVGVHSHRSVVEVEHFIARFAVFVLYFTYSFKVGVYALFLAARKDVVRPIFCKLLVLFNEFPIRFVGIEVVGKIRKNGVLRRRARRGKGCRQYARYQSGGDKTKLSFHFFLL